MEAVEAVDHSVIKWRAPPEDSDLQVSDFEVFHLDATCACFFFSSNKT